MNGMTATTGWSSSLNIDSSSFIAEKELIEAFEKRSSTVVCKEQQRLFSQKFGPEMERFVAQLKEDAYIQIFGDAGK